MNVRRQVGSSYQNISSLEITGTQLDKQTFVSYQFSAPTVCVSVQYTCTCHTAGPVLPSSLHAILTLLRPAQKGNFSAALYTHTPTAVMNVHGTKQQVTHRKHEAAFCLIHECHACMSCSLNVIKSTLMSTLLLSKQPADDA